VQVKTKIYEHHGDGVLDFIDSGMCDIYEPEIKKGSIDIITPHVTIAIGNYRLHLNRDDFLKFAKRVEV